MPPDRKPAAPSPHVGNVDRKHEQAERDHPEAEHGQEAHEPSGQEQDAETDAQRFRLRQLEMAIGEADLVGHARAFRAARDAATVLSCQRARKPLASHARICYEPPSCA